MKLINKKFMGMIFAIALLVVGVVCAVVFSNAVSRVSPVEAERCGNNTEAPNESDEWADGEDVSYDFASSEDDAITPYVTLSSSNVRIQYSECTYNGHEQKPQVAVIDDNGNLLSQGFTCNYSSCINAGQASIYVAGTGSTVSGGVFVYYTIKPAPAQISWGETSNSIFTYDGQNHAPTVKNVSTTVGPGCNVREVTGAKKDAGTYTATAVLDNSNYTPVPATCSFTINKRVADLSWSNLSPTYNGNTQTPTATVSNKVSGDDCKVTVTGGKKDAGTYTATASSLSNSNYVLPADKTKQFTIGKKTANISWGTTTSWTFDGQMHAPTATVTNKVNGDTCDVTVTGGKTEAGSYIAMASSLSNNNYQLSTTGRSTSFTIDKREITLTWGTTTTWTYDGNTYAPTVKAGNLITGFPCDVTVTGGKKEAGTHTATASDVSNSNYKLPADKTQSFTISKRTADLSWDNTLFTYNGSEQTPIATVSNKVSGDICTVTVNGGLTTVGTSTATAISLSNNNYQLPTTNTTSFTVSAAEINNVSVEGADEWTYDGSSHSSIKAQTAETVDGTAVKWEYSTDNATWVTDVPEFTNASDNGTKVYYRVTADNHVTKTGTVTVKIAPYAISADNTGIGDISEQVYTGSAIEPGAVVTNDDFILVNGVNYTVSYENNVGAGTATVIITGTGNYTGSVSATFYITPYALSADNTSIANIPEQGYTGSAIEPIPEVTNDDFTLVNGKDYTVSYENNVEEGTATVTVTGKGNYTGSVSTTFDIKKGAPTIPPTGGNDPMDPPSGGNEESVAGLATALSVLLTVLVFAGIAAVTIIIFRKKKN